MFVGGSFANSIGRKIEQLLLFFSIQSPYSEGGIVRGGGGGRRCGQWRQVVCARPRLTLGRLCYRSLPRPRRLSESYEKQPNTALMAQCQRQIQPNARDSALPLCHFLTRAGIGVVVFGHPSCGFFAIYRFWHTCLCIFSAHVKILEPGHSRLGHQITSSDLISERKS